MPTMPSSVVILATEHGHDLAVVLGDQAGLYPEPESGTSKRRTSTSVILIQSSPRITITSEGL